MPQPKILILDIETCPIEGNFWGLFDQNIGLNQITEDWSVLSYTAKWLGAADFEYRDTGGRGPAKVRDDSELLGHLWNLLDAADIVIGQNSRRFDVKKINARLIKGGWVPYSPIRQIDTLEMAKACAGFTSNKLEYLATVAGVEKDAHKQFPGYALWSECLKDNPAAWAEMRKYNPTDVASTEQVYLKLRPWYNKHPNLAIYYDDEKTRCPKCGSEHVSYSGSHHSNVSEYQVYTCHDCGGHSRTRTTENTRAKRRASLTSL